MTRGHRHGSLECKKIFERLSEYLDEELDPSICDQVNSHMDGCGRCQDFLESLRRTVKLIGRVPAPDLPDEIRREIRTALMRSRGETD